MRGGGPTCPRVVVLFCTPAPEHTVDCARAAETFTSWPVLCEVERVLLCDGGVCPVVRRAGEGMEVRVAWGQQRGSKIRGEREEREDRRSDKRQGMVVVVAVVGGRSGDAPGISI